MLRGADLAPGEIAWTQLLGEELALWRDATGGVNAWANRCPHRGVRLTLGDNLGTELRCRYHGWRFAAGSAACTVIPAHPERTPSASLRAIAYACREVHGFVWVNLDAGAGPLAAPAGLEGATPARSVVVHAAEAQVADALRAVDGAIFALQPLSPRATVVHAALPAVLAGDERRSALREHDRRLRALRDRLERDAAP